MVILTFDKTYAGLSLQFLLKLKTWFNAFGTKLWSRQSTIKPNSYPNDSQVEKISKDREDEGLEGFNDFKISL